MPRAAQIQAPLHGLLQGNVKGKTPIVWNRETEAAFHDTKVGLAQAALPEEGSSMHTTAVPVSLPYRSILCRYSIRLRG